ncbi:MAG: SMR family transporter [Evtepia sp.]
MAWVYLIVAGGLETLWATTMQLSEGFTKLGYSLAYPGGDGGQRFVAGPGHEEPAHGHGLRRVDGIAPWGR